MCLYNVHCTMYMCACSNQRPMCVLIACMKDVGMYVGMNVCVCTYACVCVRACVCVCVCTKVCVTIYRYGEITACVCVFIYVMYYNYTFK